MRVSSEEESTDLPIFVRKVSPPILTGRREANDSGSSGGSLVVGVLGIVCWR